MSARNANSKKIVVAGMGSLNFNVWDLSLLVNAVLGVSMNFERVGFQHNGNVIVKVESEEAKWQIIRRSSEFQFHGVRFFTCHTRKESQVIGWLKEKARELEEIGVKTKTIFLGMFIDGYKWVWDDLEGRLIETGIKDMRY